ncbi:hypothetical protein BC831DRAFT_461530 [Entophlyctis helioformis]|nr:hypothetical protein BC831DRAFT_461530 [Entophlyctis helioformis]
MLNAIGQGQMIVADRSIIMDGALTASPAAVGSLSGNATTFSPLGYASAHGSFGPGNASHLVMLGSLGSSGGPSGVNVGPSALSGLSGFGVTGTRGSGTLNASPGGPFSMTSGTGSGFGMGSSAAFGYGVDDNASSLLAADDTMTVFSRTSSVQSAPYSRYLVVRSDALNKYRQDNQEQIPEAIRDKPIIFTTSNGSPMSLFSVIPNRDGRQKVRKHRSQSRYSVNPYLERMGLNININMNINNIIDPTKRKPFAESFAQYLEPAKTLEQSPIGEPNAYNPYFLDDPELKIGRHKTVITLPCFLGTIIQPSKPSEIKRELNEHFRETHPSIDASITLSQIRNLKAKLLDIAIVQDLELSSVASAYVYFEKLVLRGFVVKANRRLIGAVCLLLAAKVNDPKELNYAKLLETVEKVLDIPPKEVYNQEFAVYAKLEFTLFLPLWEIMPHLERILEEKSELPRDCALDWLAHADN